MADHTAVILTHGEWLHTLREVSLDSADDEPSAGFHRIRETNTLLMLAPDDALVDGLLALHSARLEALLAVDAPEAAIMAMLDHGSSYMLSYGGYGQALATIALPSQQEISCAGATPALALIGALALSLANAAVAMRATARQPPANARAVLH